MIGGGWLAGPAQGARVAGPGRAGQPATADYFVYIFCMYTRYHKMAIVMGFLNC